MTWSNRAEKKIKKLELGILKKKILMNIIVEKYAWRACIYGYVQRSITIFAPLLGIINLLVKDQYKLDVIYTVISILVACLSEVKNLVEFDEIRDTAKSQSVKYQQLYTRIERERERLIKQPEEDFIYQKRERFLDIEQNDPESSPDIYEKFQSVCKKLGIPYDENIEEIKRLLEEEVITIVVDETHADEDEKNSHNDSVVISSNLDVSVSENDEPVSHTKTVRERVMSDEKDRKSFKESIVNFNVQTDNEQAFNNIKNVMYRSDDALNTDDLFD